MGCCGKMIHGAAGLAKAVLGIDAAPADEFTRRIRICLGHPTGGPDAIERCPHYAKRKCEKCGCFISAKARIAGEKCPIGRW